MPRDRRAENIMEVGFGIANMMNTINKSNEDKELTDLKKQGAQQDLEMGQQQIDANNQRKQDAADEKTYYGMLRNKKNPEAELSAKQRQNEDDLGIANNSTVNINQTALRKAHLANYDDMTKDAQWQQTKRINVQGKADAALSGFKNEISRMNALKDTDPVQTNMHKAEAFNYISTGWDVEYDSKEDKFYRMEPDGDGGLVRGADVTSQVPSLDKINEQAQWLIDKNGFQQMYLATHMEDIDKNKLAIMNAEDVVNEKGEVVGLLSKGNKEGKPDWRYSANDTDNTMGWRQAKEKGLQTATAYRAGEKSDADLALTKSKTKGYNDSANGGLTAYQKENLTQKVSEAIQKNEANYIQSEATGLNELLKDGDPDAMAKLDAIKQNARDRSAWMSKYAKEQKDIHGSFPTQTDMVLAFDAAIRDAEASAGLQQALGAAGEAGGPAQSPEVAPSAPAPVLEPASKGKGIVPQLTAENQDSNILDELIEEGRNMTDEEKAARIAAKKKRDRKSFVRQPPVRGIR